jgi:hypothetical protein
MLQQCCQHRRAVARRLPALDAFLVRNVLREAIYHGDDQTLTVDAQDAIHVISESEMK